MILGAMLLKAVFKHRMSPWLHYAVWFVLLARLMLPFTVESGFHIFTAPAQTQAETAVSSDTQSAAPAAAYNMISDDITSDDIKPIIDNSSPMSAVSPVSSAAPVTNKPLSTEAVLLIVWLSGTGVSLIYIVVLFGSLRRYGAQISSASISATTGPQNFIGSATARLPALRKRTSR